MTRFFAIIISLAMIISLSLASRQALAFNPFDNQATDDMNNYSRDITNNNYNQDTDENSLHVIVGQVIQVFLGLLATIFILLLVLAGYNWMTAAGSEDKVKKAQETIKVAIIGLLIILAAYIITYFVFLAVPEGVPRL